MVGDIVTDREQTHSSCCDVCGNPPRPGTVCANRAELKRLAEGSTPAYDEHRLRIESDPAPEENFQARVQEARRLLAYGTEDEVIAYLLNVPVERVSEVT